MEQRESVYEMRRKAPLHFWAKANNTHYAVYLMYIVSESERERAKADLDYDGTPSVALVELIQREGALALELILKGVIAQRIQNRNSAFNLRLAPATHRLDDLWRKAELPPLKEERLYWLLFAQEILIWAGRYAAPKNDCDGYAAEERLSRHKESFRIPEFKEATIYRFRPFGWNEFSDLYDEAAAAFCALQEKPSVSISDFKAWPA